ncbi:hypothetical protein [Crinalium epipsammum]|uniref:hypothetical protein n=1 Tax=Crinalium epipsammum TaxID=241425 RepID=UPI0012F8CFF4|nr:hypothetical protein [Crinalium epipsammum]
MVAKAMGDKQILSSDDLADLKQYELDTRTPLWFYILREADVLGDDGTRLGPVGGRIVAEVFIGLLEGDSLSYLRQNPDWKPILGSSGNFTIVDLLKFAGVVSSL